MRVLSILAASWSLALGASAAEPAKVSVYPNGTNPAESVVAVTPTVLEGTLVPAPTKMIEMPVSCEPPSISARFRDRFLPVSPTVCAPAAKECGDCGGTPCGKPLFRGPRLAADCGTTVCESPGRPGLFAGFFSRSSCSMCETNSCESGEFGKPIFSGRAMSCAGSILARIKHWLCYRPCDGPRIASFRLEPYMPRTMTVFPSDGCRMGSCHAAAGCGLGIGGRIGNGSCATGQCASGHCGDGAGLGSRLFAGRGKGPQDCNAAEPKLGGTAFCSGYRFATVEPKQYGGLSMQIDPISGTVKLPKEKGDNKKDATVNEVTKIEQASANLPQSYPLPFLKPAAIKDAKANPLATPFSNP